MKKSVYEEIFFFSQNLTKMDEKKYFFNYQKMFPSALDVV